MESVGHLLIGRYCGKPKRKTVNRCQKAHKNVLPRRKPECGTTLMAPVQANSTARVVLCMQAFQTLTGHMGVNRGGGDVGVA